MTNAVDATTARSTFFYLSLVTKDVNAAIQIVILYFILTNFCCCCLLMFSSTIQGLIRVNEFKMKVLNFSFLRVSYLLCAKLTMKIVFEVT